MAEKRGYIQRGRAKSQAETRARILNVTRELIPSTSTSLPIAQIARSAGVAMQTIYDHFGSKGGLLVALIRDVQESSGLFEAFPWIFSSAHGEEAMRRMIQTTVGLWASAWTYLEFILRAQRVDAVVGREMTFVDRLREAHYWAIVNRLEHEGRLRAGLNADAATERAMALTSATVYEALSVRGTATEEEAVSTVTLAVFGAILTPGTEPVLEPTPDWKALEEQAFARAASRGSDPDRLSVNWAASRQSRAAKAVAVIGSRDDEPGSGLRIRRGPAGRAGPG